MSYSSMFADLDFGKAHDAYLDKIAHAAEYEERARENYAKMLNRDQDSDDAYEQSIANN